MQYTVAFMTYCLVEEKDDQHFFPRENARGSRVAPSDYLPSSYLGEFDAFSGLLLELAFHFASL
jgi:hypothetical protein